MNLVRMRTRVGDKRVFTLFFNGKWVTMATGLQTVDATSLAEASQNHLALALNLQSQKNAITERYLGRNEDSPSQDEEKEVVSETESGL